MILGCADYGAAARFSVDVVVVGTGAGGAVAGAELAEAGLDVVLVEEGAHHPTSSFNPYATETVPRLYRDAGATLIFGKPDIAYMEGRCVGGSTVINGGMTYRAPERILDGWAARSGIAELDARGLDRYYARVEQRIHVAPPLPEFVGGDSRVMQDGARKLGWKYEVNRRAHDLCVGANHCVFGCPTGAKQSTLVSYMPRALAAGARCLTQVRVDRLLIERGRAVGVSGRVIDPRTQRAGGRIEVHARAVIVAAGAIQTPHLLLRHGVGRPSGLLGRNLLCHPNVKVLALYPHAVRGWQGVNQLGQIREFDDEGILLAENMVPPAAVAALMPFHGKRGFEFMRRYDQLAATGVLVEDSTTGRVRRGPFDVVLPSYHITALDLARFIKGTVKLAELHFSMGAERVVLPFLQHPVVESMDALRAIDWSRVRRTDMELLTVHMMGTAAMGARAGSSVVDPDGQLWDLPGCYVSDASLFPAAIGRNPQLTIMALATRLAERLAEQLLARRVA